MSDFVPAAGLYAGEAFPVQPQRIQLRRTKGWRKPEGTVVVSRPGCWGNPWAPIHEVGTSSWFITGRVPGGAVLMNHRMHHHPTREAAIADCIAMYRLMILNAAEDDGVTPAEYLEELAGHDLACWCPLDHPCHADVLLELANPASRNPEETP